MGEIRIVGPGKTRGYPYPVCKKEFALLLAVLENSVLLMGWDSLREILTKSEKSCLQTFFISCNKKRQMTFGVGRYTT